MTLWYSGEREVDEHPIEPIGWTVREFVLIHSLRGHTHLARWPLGGMIATIGDLRIEGWTKLPNTIYGIKNCDTMKKARAWLDSHGVAYAFHDYKTAGVAKDKLKGWSDEVGWETLLNRAGTTFKKLPDADREGLSERKALALMLAQPSMIKRPVLERSWQIAGRVQARNLRQGNSRQGEIEVLISMTSSVDRRLRAWRRYAIDDGVDDAHRHVQGM